VVAPWVTQSNGRAEVSCVRGGALAAMAALGATDARVAELETGQALAQIAWAAASGGAHGRRRGAAAGRHLAWACAGALGGNEYPLRWFSGDDDTGWKLHLAAEDPARGLAWALAASDHT
jgi:hypothetical protein